MEIDNQKETKKVLKQNLKNDEHFSLKNSINNNSIKNKELTSIPVMFFINKKSGSKKGHIILDLIPKEVSIILLNLFLELGKSFLC